jgi:hypothetical protein
MAEKSCFYFLKIYLKNFNFLFFYFKLNFLVFLDHPDTLILKITLKKYIYIILIYF